jgi:hypothetical protein
MIEHPVQWAAPSPLWLEATAFEGFAAQGKMREPAILRFAADSFMEDFLKIVETDSDKLRDLVAIKETWRGPLETREATGLLSLTEPRSSFARKLDRVRRAAERARNRSSLLGAVSNGETRRAAPLKLYQPAHQRYYLVSACLVCGVVGFPDRALDAGKNEKVNFVIRRLLPSELPDPRTDLPDVDPSAWDEYAMVGSPAGAGWQKLEKVPGAAPAVVLPGEERLPLFPVSFTEDDERKRRLFAGLVPVGRREGYMGAPRRPAGDPQSAGPSSDAAKKNDPRMSLVWTQVTEPWKRLIERAAAARQMQSPPASAEFPSKDEPLPPDAKRTSLKAAREQIQTVSWYIILDFAKLLKEHLPEIVQALAGRASPRPEQLPLIDALNRARLGTNLISDLRIGTPYQNPATIPQSLAEALLRMLGGSSLDESSAAALEDKLDKVTAPYNRSASNAASVWAPFLFPLADVGAPTDTSFVGPFPPPAPGPEDPDPLKAALGRIDHLSDLIQAALPPLPDQPMPAPAIGAEAPLDLREGWFVMRCVFERPNCGPLEPGIVSAPTRPFQMAGFFDPDAPARPIRIALPVDTSPAGLRKFDKKAAFLISDMLCGQIDRVKGLTLGDLVRSVLPWPLHKDLSVPDKGPCKDPKDASLQVGMICSLSIPIITICALILLLIIVNLLDIIFRWIPYFIMCFPLPGFKAKKS